MVILVSNGDYMIEEVKNELFRLQDLDYQKFHSNLCPGTTNIIGVRVPKIRLLVKDLLKKDYKCYLDNVDNKYYEETMVEGLIIATSKMTIEEKIFYLDKFVPKIDNWAICDTVCSSFKLKEKDLDKVWKYILKYKNSKNEFELRFMIIMMMDYFLIDEYIDEVLVVIDSIKIDYYYTNMAIAWLISVLYVKDKNKTLDYLNMCNLSDFTYNKSLQKIIESNRVSNEEKRIIRTMKR